MRYFGLTNPAWAGKIKVSRTSSESPSMAPYQHLSPYKDYVLEFITEDKGYKCKTGWFDYDEDCGEGQKNEKGGLDCFIEKHFDPSNRVINNTIPANEV